MKCLLVLMMTAVVAVHCKPNRVAKRQVACDDPEDFYSDVLMRCVECLSDANCEAEDRCSDQGECEDPEDLVGGGGNTGGNNGGNGGNGGTAPSVASCAYDEKVYDAVNNKCVDCVLDSDCPLGEFCVLESYAGAEPECREEQNPS